MLFPGEQLSRHAFGLPCGLGDAGYLRDGERSFVQQVNFGRDPLRLGKPRGVGEFLKIRRAQGAYAFPQRGIRDWWDPYAHQPHSQKCSRGTVYR